MKIDKRINNIIVHLNKAEVLKVKDIYKYLNRCRSLYGYFKVNFSNNYYIIINYNKDATISISSNNRNVQLYREMTNLMNIYTQDRACKFIFRWINILNK